MLYFERKAHYDYPDLLRIISLLRSAEGCPWDKEQTHESIRRGLLEEAYEAAEAIDSGDPDLLREELGDVLMQVVFHADIEKDAHRFTMSDVCDGIVRKMLYRHPHVFGDAHEDSAASVLVSWEALKRTEKGQQTTADAMDSVSRSLPALWRSEKIQGKAAKDGFDWADVSGAMDKLREEVDELQAAIDSRSGAQEELGDVLFAAVKAARFLGVDPEAALHAACDKFIGRYRRMERAAEAQGRPLSQQAPEELTALWDRAKHP